MIKHESVKTVLSTTRVFVCLLLVAVLSVVIWYGVGRLYQPGVEFLWADGFTEEQNYQINSMIERLMINGKVEDLASLKQSVEKLSWVKAIRIRRGIGRYWLDISVFIPIAILNDRWLLSSDGKRKEIYNHNGYTALIKYQFDVKQQQDLLPKVQEFHQQLQSLDIIIRKWLVTPAGNWSVETDSGMAVHFGAGQMQEQINKLAVLLPAIRLRGNPVRVDLRNKLGVAVRYDETRDVR